MMANMIASLDHISNGRLEIGLGAGWSEEECAAYGIPLGSRTERFDRFDESCEVIHSLLTQNTTDFTGKYFNLTNARCDPKPLQKPHPPWCIGGNGERRTLPNVVRWAGHWNYAGFDLAGFQAKREQLHQQCRAANRDPESITTSIHVPVNMQALAELEQQLKQFKAAGLDLAILYLPPPHSPAVLEPLADIAARVNGS